MQCPMRDFAWQSANLDAQVVTNNQSYLVFLVRVQHLVAFELLLIKLVICFIVGFVNFPTTNERLASAPGQGLNLAGDLGCLELYILLSCSVFGCAKK